MAVTKILARRARLDVLINYVLNGDKTDDRILTAYHNVTEHNPYLAMKQTKLDAGKTDGVQCYHIIQSFAPREIRPEQALEIAQQFCQKHLWGYEAVIGVHVDKNHVHAHIAFNSVNKYTRKKYHSNVKTYYEQIRGISDRLCQEHALSIIMRGEATQAVTYVEWLREQKGQPTYAGMLNADLRMAIDQAAGYGHFLMLMEHMGYEIKHGKYLSFRLKGTQNFIRPGRKNALFMESGIRAAIEGRLEAAGAGLSLIAAAHKPYVPFRPKAKLSGFVALYAHYLYLLGKIGKREYPPRMTPRLKRELMRFEQYKEQFRFLRVYGIESESQLSAYQSQAESKLAILTKRRTILNVQKKKRKPLYDALATEQALRPAKKLYASGTPGIEDEFTTYMDAATLLDGCGMSRERLLQEKTKAYQDIADINGEIRAIRKEISLCEAIHEWTPRMERDIQSTIVKQREVTKEHATRK
ncbi:relaxase/mobilization nuclease domain-containing protein [Christensenella minuta]|uniref:relaxase/mobilization nuclease domain-containing protein n=1 Tax=Christensenella minuta TaxID=626937 RepID=UPI0021583EC8|nr:relaxase/mobilization nuclease domain-containing protein [Christensenella minuta]